jgi:hypothetical protein
LPRARRRGAAISFQCILGMELLGGYAGRSVNSYFWRTYDQKEIDYLITFRNKYLID